MRVINISKNFVIGSAAAVLILLGVNAASAQNRAEEYREWQNAQRKAQEEYRDYQRTRRSTDYRQWQRAQRQAQREYIEYQRANNMYNAGRGVGWGYGRNPNVNRRVYRVYRNGQYYQTDYRGAELLRNAVNRGYQQGYLAGQRDRRYGRGDNYYDESLYRNGTYGYQSYVARDQYQYYFQQGFQRGYEDGYRSSSRYGYRSGSNWNILGTVLNGILNLTQD